MNEIKEEDNYNLNFSLCQFYGRSSSSFLIMHSLRIECVVVCVCVCVCVRERELPVYTVWLSSSIA